MPNHKIYASVNNDWLVDGDCGRKLRFFRDGGYRWCAGGDDPSLKLINLDHQDCEPIAECAGCLASRAASFKRNIPTALSAEDMTSDNLQRRVIYIPQQDMDEPDPKLLRIERGVVVRWVPASDSSINYAMVRYRPGQTAQLTALFNLFWEN